MINFKENIKYRSYLAEKAINKQKITKEEREWLAENPVFNERYEEERFQVDILQLTPNCMCDVFVTVEVFDDSIDRMIPLFGVADKIGSIQCKNNLLDINENISKTNQTKVLGLIIDPPFQKAHFSFQSKKGLMSVGYQCDYYNNRTKLHMRENSAGASLAFAMIKTIISERKIKYSCKSPIADSFDAFVFCVEWAEVQTD